eukprot:m.34058 g.34058  ORF g.34058 m.34058 type:complete len:611 (+) comp5645_c0_seq1:70-1902(+)
MGRIKKKGTSGEATNYISRSRAVRRLQISLADFRRLCILKGIYPREPKNKKKVGGNAHPSTYYYVKDIKYLAHEPLLEKFRENKAFLRKLSRAKAKRESKLAESLEESRPKFKVAHIIKERYPTFVDAVRDLDDALCLVFLFAQLPQTYSVQMETISKCNRLACEFLRYVIQARALRKVFLSIKGIYFQAEIAGQPVTWITPYQFTQRIPTDVDFRVMDTFLLFYTSLVGFINFQLYKGLNLIYPPRVDEAKLSRGLDISAIILENAESDSKFALPAAEAASKAPKATISLPKEALEPMADDADDDEEEEDEGTAMTDVAPNTTNLDQFPEQMEGGEQTVAGLSEEDKQLEAFQHMFDGLNFFLGREVPQQALDLVIRAFGGHVSRQTSDGELPAAGSYDEHDSRITHQIVDRPSQQHTYLDRHYLQPQWVFDCINARQLLPTAPYAPGASLPSHLSPFVVEGEGEYVPPERAGLTMQRQPDDLDAEDDNDEQDDGEQDEEEEELSDEEVYRRDLEAEMRGGESDAEESAVAAAVPKAKAGKKAKKQPKRSAEEEETELAKAMMTNKQQRLYSRIMHSKAKKKEEAEELTRKRKAYDAEQRKLKKKTRSK